MRRNLCRNFRRYLLWLFVLCLLAPLAGKAAPDADADAAGLKLAAERGEPEAQRLYGLRFFFGQGVPLDPQTGEAWLKKAASSYRKAAEAGDPKAQSTLGVMYLRGDHVERNPGEAKQWLRKAADRGDPVGQYFMGSFCLAPPQDIKKALYWFTKAAEQGDKPAQARLGWLYYTGYYGVPERLDEACKWLEKAAEQGDARSQMYLGNILQFQGMPVPSKTGKALIGPSPDFPTTRVDFEQAVKWYSKAAEQGNAIAQYYLASCYLQSKGVPYDLEKGLMWLNRSAERGYSQAKYFFGYLYDQGVHLPHDKVKNYMWWKLALDDGYGGAAHLLDRLKATMTPEQIEEGMKLVFDWKTRFYKAEAE